MTRAKNTDEFVRDMRELCNFLELHPELGVPNSTSTVDWYFWGDSEENGPKMKLFAQAFRTFEKNFTEYTAAISKPFGSLRLTVSFDRPAVCTQRKVGTRLVTSREPVTYQNVEREVPIYEYDCPSLLSPEEVQADLDPDLEVDEALALDEELATRPGGQSE